MPVQNDKLLRSVKRTLRKQMTAELNQICDKEVARQSAAVLLHLMAFPQIALLLSQGCSVYLPMEGGREVNTWPIVAKIFSNTHEGGGVYVPLVTGGKAMDMSMLRANSEAELRALPLDNWRIPKPPMDWIDLRLDAAVTGDIGVILVPGVAFDGKCNRLGHGKGYYDAFITRVMEMRAARKMSPPVTIGLALGPQIVEAVPVGAMDRQLDFVICPDRVICAEK